MRGPIGKRPDFGREIMVTTIAHHMNKQCSILVCLLRKFSTFQFFSKSH